MAGFIVNRCIASGPLSWQKCILYALATVRTVLEAFCIRAVHPCMRLSMIIYWKFVNTISYKPLAGILSDLQLRCRWTRDEL